MDADKISKVIDTSFDSVFSSWSRKIEKDLYPSAFADEYSCLRVKDSLKTNNLFLKESLKQVLIELLADN